MDVRKEEMNGDKDSRIRLRRSEDDGRSGVDSGVMESCCGEGRVWIFLVLGILALVFSVVLMGVDMNVRSLTSSMESVEVIPSFLPAAAGGLTGLLVLLLFWKRYKVLVYAVMVLCAVAVAMCVVAAVLTGTHVLQPLLNVSGCVFSSRDKMCRCTTQFRRDKFEIERVANGEQVYLVMQEVSSCGDVEEVLPGMLFTMIGIYGVISLVCVAAGIISLLVYQTEQRRKYQEDIEDDIYSNHSSPSCSDSYAEHHTMLPAHPAPHSNVTTLTNIYTNPSSTTTNEEDNNTNDDGNTTPSDVIYSPADVPMGYAEACRMRRCQSFSQPRQEGMREGSPGSSASSQTASLIGGDRYISGAEGGPGKLKEHRKKGRRAVTLHGLDREQLLLILSLQMRYLQESDQSAKKEGTNNNFSNINSNTIGGRVDGSGCNTIGGRVNGSGQDNADFSVMYGEGQRRAMTPTPRQERLSSSRTTDDDLDYRPAKLARSHTPQPYHFKNPSQYSQNFSNQHQLQSHQFHPCQQQQPTQQSQQSQAASNHEEEEEEPPTLITYDLRNITKTGPIVYENIPSAAGSVSYFSPESLSSNSSPLLHSAKGGRQANLTSRLPQTGQLQPSPAHQPSDPLNQVMILGGNIQGVRSSQGQFSRQTSQVSTSSQPSLDNSPSDTRKLVPSKEKTSEQGSVKTKGKKKKSKKEKNLKKDEGIAQATSSQSTGLSRTDSNASKGGVADRWQILMEDGPKQAQTLWENVQRKIVSDPQTPDSTLELHHPALSAHQSYGGDSGIKDYISSHTTPRNSTFQTVCSPKLPQQGSSSQVVRNGILKNSNTTGNYSSGVTLAAQSLPQKLPSPLNLCQDMHYPNPNPVHTNQYSSSYHNAFVPIANSSVENYEDIDGFIPISATSSGDMHGIAAPAKPPRILGRQMDKFGTHPKSTHPFSENLGQNLRPKSYMNAVDREAMGRNSCIDPRNTASRPHIQGADLEYQMMTHLLMEGPVKDNITGNLMSRSPEGSSHFQTGNECLYAQPHKKSNPVPEVVSASPQYNPVSASPQYNPVHVYQNAGQHPDGVMQLKEIQQQFPHFHSDSIHHPQWSAFQSFDQNHKPGSPFFEYPPAGHEICDTDLDDLPRPQHRQHISNHVYTSPQHAAPPVYQSLESVNRLSSTRSGSSSSCDPHNTSGTSSQRSGTPVSDLQRGLPDLRVQGHNGNVNKVQIRGYQPTNITDRRFCITQQKSNQL